MFNVNRTTLLGTVTRDAEQGTRESGIAYTVIGLATRCNSPVQKPRTEAEIEFHRVLCFGTLAKFAAKLKKGTPLYVEGRNHTVRRVAKGKDVQVIEVIADKLVALSKKNTTDAELD